MIYRRDNPATLKAASERMARMNRDPVIKARAMAGRKRPRPAKVKQPAKQWRIPDGYEEIYTAKRKKCGVEWARVWLAEQMKRDQRKAA